LDKQDIKSDLTYYIMKIIYLFIFLWNKGFKFFIIIIFSSLCTIKKMNVLSSQYILTDE